MNKLSVIVQLLKSIDSKLSAISNASNTSEIISENNQSSNDTE